MKRTIIYARVSTEDQVEKYGLPLQLRACREYAKSHGLLVVKELTDDGISGTILARPALDQVRALVAQGGADVVLMFDVDRLSRELAHLLILKPEIEKRAQLAFVLSSFEDSPSGRMFFGIRGVIAQYEREQTRERTMRGKRERARSGLIVGGRVAYGYNYQDGKLVADGHRAEIVREIFDRYCSGASMRSIALWLRSSGVSTWSGRAWGHSSVRRILSNETYAGVAYYGTHRREGTVLRMRQPSERIALSVPALVTRETWERAQSQMAFNPSVGRPSTGYLLRGLLYCSCGRKMTGDQRRKYRAYRCNGRDALRFRGGACRCSVNAPKVDAVVWRTVVNAVTDAGFLRGILADHQRELSQPDPARLDQLKAQVRRLRGKEDAVLYAMIDPDLAASRATLKAQYQHAQCERKRLDAEIASLEGKMRASGSPAEWLNETVALLREYIPTIAEPKQQQEFLRDVVTRAEWDGNELRIGCFLGAKSGTMFS